ncbi:MAG: TIGR00159 family protein, partial [Candidatus Omnitrophica bacterium]|nr:TIGR00159 family protein [Candidatus Omnitrophota bacterium]
MHNIALYWKPAVEIVILWYLIYQIMLFFEGTRALQALKGIIILLLAFLIFQRFDFVVLKWIFEKLFGISVIAILIIFHPEIRMGLAQLGKRQIFRNILKEEDIIILGRQVVEGCENLIKNKLGALIAIEKNESLVAFI